MNLSFDDKSKSSDGDDIGKTSVERITKRAGGKTPRERVIKPSLKRKRSP